MVLVVISGFAFAPIGSVMLCGAIANAYGCKVDEGSVHPCIINGQDYGHLLYTLGVLGWLMLDRAAWQKRVSAGVPPPIPTPRATT